MTRVSKNGFERTRLNERIEQLQRAMREIFGPNLDLEADTVDGQTLGIFAYCISELDQLAELTYQSFHPQTACGQALSRLVELNGIRRKSGTYSTVNLTLGGLPQTVVPAGSLVFKKNGDDAFETMHDATIEASGYTTVKAQSLIKGSVAAPIGSLTKIGTPIYGWQTVVNESAALEGQTDETDEALRVRRASSVGATSCGTLDGLYGALMALTNVKRVRVHEDVNAHSLHVIVEGGCDEEIARTIWHKKSAGVKLVGLEKVEVADSQGIVRPIFFSRVMVAPIVVHIRLRPLPGFSPECITQITKSVTLWAQDNQDIGEAVVVSRLYTPLNQVKHHSILSLEVGRVGGVLSTRNLVMNENEVARIYPEYVHIVLE